MMAGYGDGGTPADEQVPASGDARVPGRHSHERQVPPAGFPDHDGPGRVPVGAAGMQVGSGNVQVNNYFCGDSARAGAGGEPLAPAPRMSESGHRGHVFISYVREDSREVGALQNMLEAAGIPVWRDTASLWAGEDWRASIRDAITRDALVFIACFSGHSAARQASYQNEELLLAIDQLRRRRPGDPWLIPVRFDNCDIPDFELGAGRTLASIQRVDLFGADRAVAGERLVAAVLRLLGRPAATIAASAAPPAGGATGSRVDGASAEVHRIPGVPAEPAAPRSMSPVKGALEPGADVKKGHGASVICPTCFSAIDWEQADLWCWDDSQGEYVQIVVPKTASERDRARITRGAVVSCPDPGQTYGEMHFLPYEYGSYGKSILLAFFGDAGSGKSHLLAALIGEIGEGLSSLNIEVHPMDLALHRRSLDLYDQMHRWRRVLPATQAEGASFADAFVVRPPRGAARSVAFLDVTGISHRLASTAALLAGVDGFIFVVDSARLRDEFTDHSTSGRVLNLLRASGALRRANITVALTKGDLLPSAHPLARWLSAPLAEPEPQMASQESAEIIAYLDSIGASGWSKFRPECGKMTLHVVSAFKDAGIPAGAASGPRRVLEPLVAMLAMTGVLSGKGAQRIGA